MFTQEVADVICDEIANGKSLREVCRQEGMPDKTTVLRWLSKDDAGAFRTQYARACEERGIALAEDSLVEARSAQGMDAPGVAAQRLIVDTLKWHASKLANKKYGDKIETTVQGADGGAVQLDVTFSPEEAYKRMLG